MNNIEALQLALDALGPTAPECCGCAVEWEIAITSIRQAIEQAQQAEPVAFASHGVVNWIADKQFQHEADLYTSPPPRQPLTVEQIIAIIHPIVMADMPDEMTDYEIARAIEAAHGIKEKKHD